MIRDKIITNVLSVMKTGHYFPPQLVYAGKTSRCFPKVTFPSGWCITCTENHWANEVTTLTYMDEILFELGLPDEQTCLVIFDRFKAHAQQLFLKHWSSKWWLSKHPTICSTILFLWANHSILEQLILAMEQIC